MSRRHPTEREFVAGLVLNGITSGLVLAIAAMLLLILACSSPVAPAPTDPEHEALWLRTAQCAGIEPGPMPIVILVEAHPIKGSFQCVSPKGCLGAWVPGKVYIADSWRGRAPHTIQHEFLHELLGGDPLHSRPEWVACHLEP